MTLSAGTRRHRSAVALAMGASLAAGAVDAVAQDRVAVFAEPDGVMVGVTAVVAGGSALESESENGVAYLAGEATLEEIRHRLERRGGTAAVECDAGALTFTLLLPAAGWRGGTELLLEQLRRHTPSDAAIERAKTRVVRALSLGDGNPAADVRQLTREVLFQQAERWTRPPCGQAALVSEIEAGAVERHVRTRFSPAGISVAVVGPVDERAATQFVQRLLGQAGSRKTLPKPPELEGGERRVQRNTVTTWTTLAFPIGDEADPEALRFLGFRLREAVAPSPARPDVHDVEVELAPDGEHGVLAIHLVTDPDTADRWRTTLIELASDLARAPLHEEVFDALLRRYRGARLLELAAPEARAREAARELFLGRNVARTVERIDALDPEGVQRAAQALETPAAVLLGP